MRQIMRKSTTNGSVFTRHLRRRKGTPSSTSPSLQESPSWSVYRRLTSIPLDNLITCLCDDDLSALVIAGNPPAEVLAQACLDIHDEWVEGLQTEEYEDVKELTKEINLFTTKYN